MYLTLSDILTLVLLIFAIICGTLLTLILLRVLKILGVVSEITGYYWNIKNMFVQYAFLPFLFKDKVQGFFSKDSDNEEK